MQTFVLVTDLPTSPEFFDSDRRIQNLVRRALLEEKSPILRNEHVRIVAASSSFRAAHVDKNINPVCMVIPSFGDAFMPRFLGILERVIEDFCLAKRFDAIVNVGFTILQGRSVPIEHIPRDPVEEPKRHKKRRKHSRTRFRKKR